MQEVCMVLWQVVTEFSKLWSQSCTKGCRCLNAGLVKYTWPHDVILNFFHSYFRK